jgi:hypothetical protein
MGCARRGEMGVERGRGEEAVGYSLRPSSPNPILLILRTPIRTSQTGGEAVPPLLFHFQPFLDMEVPSCNRTTLPQHQQELGAPLPPSTIYFLGTAKGQLASAAEADTPEFRLFLAGRSSWPSSSGTEDPGIKRRAAPMRANAEPPQPFNCCVRRHLSMQ